MNTRHKRALCVLLLAFALPAARAGQVSIPNSFSSGTPAVAAEVNANFDAVKTAVDDNDGRINAVSTLASANASAITALQATVASLQTALDTANDAITRLQADLATANTTIISLQGELETVTGNSVLALDGYLTYDVDQYGHARALFSGVNVQVVNGVDQVTSNGLGNLIVGYNNPRAAGDPVCSDGLHATLTDCENADEIWALSHKSGSHYLVAGDENSYSQVGGVVLGNRNAVNKSYAVVSGGRYNTASGVYSSVSGGFSGKATRDAASVSGGFRNTASGVFSSVSGGGINTADGLYSSVSGGDSNTASGANSSVNGGNGNTASGVGSSVGGGRTNTASGMHSSVGGGINNAVSADHGWAP